METRSLGGLYGNAGVGWVMEDLVSRLRKRAEIRRQIPTRKSVQNNEPDRIADLLEEAAMEIERLKLAVQRAEENGGYYEMMYYQNSK